MKKNVGVLAFQGDVIEHQKMIEKLGQRFFAVRSVKDLNEVDALIIPGGESTTIGFFLEETGLMEAIRERAGLQVVSSNLQATTYKLRPTSYKLQAKKPLPVWGTCAGAIVLAKHIQAQIVPPHLGLMDITVERNAYGRQIDSFYTALNIPKLKIHDLKAAFIRAPIILEVAAKPTDSKNKPEILATHEGKIVLVQQGNLLASTFHPELTDDTRLHEYFISF